MAISGPPPSGRADPHRGAGRGSCRRVLLALGLGEFRLVTVVADEVGIQRPSVQMKLAADDFRPPVVVLLPRAAALRFRAARLTRMMMRARSHAAGSVRWCAVIVRSWVASASRQQVSQRGCM